VSNKLRVLDLGRVVTDRNFIVAHSAIVTPSALETRSSLVEIPISAYLIENTYGHVLYDTGCHPDCMGPNGRWTAQHQKTGPYVSGPECSLPSRLRELGLTPDNMRYVVLSHLHNDHAGCVEFFSKAELIVHQDEFRGALQHFALHDNATNYVLKDVAQWIAQPRNWRLIGRDDPDEVLVNGMTLINLGSGHAYGMLGLAVELRDHRDVLLVSDACYCQENYDGRRAGIIHDSVGYENTLRSIHRYARARNMEVWFGHDVEQFAKLTKSTEGHYE
jgi:N-acyl homoserine lactone hydrolase